MPGSTHGIQPGVGPGQAMESLGKRGVWKNGLGAGHSISAPHVVLGEQLGRPEPPGRHWNNEQMQRELK